MRIPSTNRDKDNHQPFYKVCGFLSRHYARLCVSIPSNTDAYIIIDDKRAYGRLLLDTEFVSERLAGPVGHKPQSISNNVHKTDQMHKQASEEARTRKMCQRENGGNVNGSYCRC